MKWQEFREYINALNHNVYFAGLMMLFLNIGAKHVSIQLTETQQQLLHTTIAKQFVIFTMAWVATRDIITALGLTAVFHVLVEHLFNERSTFCILPTTVKRLESVLDTNGDGIISEDEINRAVRILEKAKQQTKHEEFGRFQFGNL
jgi:hypothetical protein